jgi:hypothetical protein
LNSDYREAAPRIFHRKRDTAHEDGHHAVHVLRRLAIASPGPEFMRIYHAISHHLDTEIARLRDRTDDRKKVEWFKRHFHDVVKPNDSGALNAQS